MRKILFFAGALLCLSQESFAFGKSRGAPNPMDPGDADAIAQALKLNPVLMTLQKEFTLASRPTTVTDGGHVEVSDAILMNHRYDCRVFHAVSKNTVSLPSEGRSWYQFKRFGKLFVDNQAYLDGGRIKTFAADVTLQNELWGQSPERNYYEGIRVTRDGDLIVEAFAPEMFWAQMVLGALGFDSLLEQLLPKIQGFELKSTVAGAAGYIISYSYCPKDPSNMATLDAILRDAELTK